MQLFKKILESIIKEIPLLYSITLILDPRANSKSIELMRKHFFKSLYDDDDYSFLIDVDIYHYNQLV